MVKNSLLNLLGLIPARAGNTPQTGYTRYLPGAHPRSRGEHRTRSMTAGIPEGSSPLARGTRIPAACTLYLAGLIPARAGNTVIQDLVRTLRGAHPRSRGEHGVSSVSSRVMTGSSPLARGTLPPAPHPQALPGLIPARAGNTSANAAQTFLPWAHPRSRGEHDKN